MNGESERGPASAVPGHVLGGQEDSGHADDEEYPDHAREDQDDYHPWLRGEDSFVIRGGVLPLSAGGMEPRWNGAGAARV